MARDRREKDDPQVFQIYFTGCGGDITAGMYNTGALTNRLMLVDRLYRGMVAAWQATKRQSLRRIDYRIAKLSLPARATGDFTVAAMQDTLANTNAALGLNWRQRVDEGRPIEVPGVL